MTAQMLAPCREIKNLLPLFFDSELDSRQMRSVALHSATCTECEIELRQLEHLQEAICQSVNGRVDELDLGAIWSGVDRNLGPAHSTWADNVRLWWQEHAESWSLRGPVLGAAAATAAIALALFWGTTPPTEVAVAPKAALAGHPVSIDSIDAATDIALLSEEDTLVLWVDEELGSFDSVP